MIDRPFAIEMDGWTLAGRLHLPDQGEPCGLAVVAHGLYADMTSVKHVAFCRLFNRLGLAAARFDARGCGESTGRVAETTLTGRARAVLAVLDRVRSELSLEDEPVFLAGSSFGGAAALLAAAWLRERGETLSSGVISMAAPCDFHPLLERWEEIRQDEMDRSYFDDLATVDMPGCLAGLAPVLVIHAVEDEVIPVDQAYTLAALTGPGSRLALLHGSDHALHAPGATEAALEEAETWLKRILKSWGNPS